MFVDSHCHLDKINPEKAGADLTQIVEMARANKVEHMLCVCVTLEDFPAMQQAVAGFNDVSISCGVHPLYVKDSQTPIVELGTKLRQLASANNVVAIGETGLDYFYHPESKALQLENFEQHIEIAKDINKPLIIHTRDAQDDTLSLLKNVHAEKSGGVVNFFTSTLDIAKKTIDELYFFIFLSGFSSF